MKPHTKQQLGSNAKGTAYPHREIFFVGGLWKRDFRRPESGESLLVLLRQTWEVPFILRTAATRPELEYWLKETPEYRKATPTNGLQRAWAELNAACYLETIKTEVGRNRCTQEDLLCDFRSSAPTGTPQSTNDDFVLVESVVEMTVYLPQIQPTNTDHIGFGIRCAGSREECKDSKGCFEFSRKDLGMNSILKPPGLFSPDVLLRSRCELDATVPQRDLMSLRISSASTSLPSMASVSDWRRASWSAARSASSSQSPGVEW